MGQALGMSFLRALFLWKQEDMLFAVMSFMLAQGYAAKACAVDTAGPWLSVCQSSVSTSFAITDSKDSMMPH